MEYVHNLDDKQMWISCIRLAYCMSTTNKDIITHYYLLTFLFLPVASLN